MVCGSGDLPLGKLSGWSQWARYEGAIDEEIPDELNS